MSTHAIASRRHWNNVHGLLYVLPSVLLLAVLLYGPAIAGFYQSLYRIGGPNRGSFVGLDVYAREPHVPQALLAAPNATLLPHLGTATDDTRTRMGLRALANLQAFIDGTDLPDAVG
mgnify:CR=1 FL=1